MAAAMTALGLPCGHEAVFGLPGRGQEWSAEYPGSSSWLAAPFLDQLDEDIIVVHQRRSPVAAAESLIRHGFFDPASPYFAFARKWVSLPETGDTGDALDFIMRWHRLIHARLLDRPHICYSIEELTASPAMLVRLARVLGADPTAEQIADFRAIPANLNSNLNGAGIFAFDVSSGVTYSECAKLWELARGKRVLEVGSWLGRSTIALASTAEHVTAVDWHHGDFWQGEEDTLERFERNLARYNIRNVEIVVAKIEEVYKKLPGPYDLIFIDAAHDLASVRTHQRIARRLVAPGGVVAFHDYGRFDVAEGLPEPKELVGTLAVYRT